MAKPAELEKLTGLASRFGAFVAERHPFALADALDAFETATGGREPRDEAAIEAARPALQRELKKRLQARALPQRAAGHDAADDRRRAHGAGARRAARRLRRLPAPRGDRRVADARRAPRDPARHAADARDRQPPQDVLPRRRGPLRRHGAPGQGVSIARTGSDLRRGDAPAPRRDVPGATAAGRATSSVR